MNVGGDIVFWHILAEDFPVGRVLDSKSIPRIELLRRGITEATVARHTLRLIAIQHPCCGPFGWAKILNASIDVSEYNVICEQFSVKRFCVEQ